MNPMFEFSVGMSENAFNAMRYAEMAAKNSGSTHIGTEHLLLGILDQGSSIGAKTLAKFNIDFEKTKVAAAVTKAKNLSGQQVQISESVGLTLRMSMELAREYHHDVCGTEHLLYSLLSQQRSRAHELIRSLGADAQLILKALEKYLEEERGEFVSEAAGTRVSRGMRGSYLNKFGTNLTQKAMAGELDPMIGREKEVTRMVTILSRRTKNNPVLIGEPGVGKTAVVEGLAQRIASEDVPEHLAEKVVYQLDLAGMIAGTKYRGEFEERIKRVVDEVRANRNVIVFIDELHLLMGAGAADGAMDAANMLKPALARGEFRLIGATTLDEYRRHIEKDTALIRRLQPIIIDEPNEKDTVKIIAGLARNYEQFHNVKLTLPVIEEAVRLAGRYITERFMPDKAIDVIDEAAALIRVRSKSQSSAELRNYRRELASLTDKMEDAAQSEDYEAAALYKMRIARLNEKIAESNGKTNADRQTTLRLNDIAQAVATMTGIPVQELKRTEVARLANLEKHLGKHVIGQDEAISQVAKSIRRSRSGISIGTRPIGSFIFMGPTGVGKTELARVIAREVFGSEKSLIKIDMSEFSEKHNTSRLVGAPAGYIGYDDGGQLTDKIRRQPYSVVLFDEIEKAHPDVFNILLQLLEDGCLTDGKGRAVDFSNTVVILTSNIGSDKFSRGSLGFHIDPNDDSSDADHSRRDMVIGELEKHMRPELLNRFDDIIVFNNLTRRRVGQIFDNMIVELNDRLAHKGLVVEISPTAKRSLTKKGYSEKFGARLLRRVIQNEVEHTIAEAILRKQFRKGEIIHVDVKNDKIILHGKAE